MTKRIQLRKQLEAGTITIDRALESLAKTGLCPAVLNDDFGNWAVLFEGYQQIPKNPGEPDNIDMSFFPRKENWKKTIKEALLDAITRE